MAKLGPHTNAYEGEGSWTPQGFDGRHESIEGFGHFHEFQIGGVVLMPTTGDLQLTPGTLEEPDQGYRSRFDQNSVRAEPGYYSVFLKDYGIQAELTATERVGFHRYTFPQSDQAHLIFDIGHKQGESSDITDSWVRWDGDKGVEGYVESYPEYVKFCDPGNRVKMYFAGQVSIIPETVGTFVGQDFQPGVNQSNQVGNGLVLSFQTEDQQVIELQVGLSYTSIENARFNLEAEIQGHSFQTARQRAQDIWNQQLGKIQVSGGEGRDRIKFYTGLYHALLGRGLASDLNGRYPQHDGSIGQIPLDTSGKPLYHHYNTDGIWGGFWNLGQLWALVYPDYLSEYVQSNIDFYKNSGWLHDGMAAGTFTNGVQTNFQGLLLASAYHCGIRDFEVETGYQAALKNEIEYQGRTFGNGKYDLSWFVKTGYVPSRDTTLSNGWVFNFGASHTLEYCFSSYAVAEMARDLGHQEDYELLIKQAGYWKNIFDPETRFIRPKYEDGQFIEEFDPLEAWRGYQEGNAFQYTWYVPHDVNALIKEVGKELFDERLEKMFEDAQKSQFGGGSEVHSFAGIEKLYNHGNQPCLFNPWLFNYTGKPWLTQKWVRAIGQDFYGTEVVHGYGYGQDEDQGQLGAWYVMAALGLFDVQGHARSNPSFQFGSPIFDEIRIQLDPKYYEGEELIIQTSNNSKENIYVQAVSWNEQEIKNCWIDRSLLTKGGTLNFELGETPNKEWGVGSPPPSMSTN